MNEKDTEPQELVTVDEQARLPTFEPVSGAPSDAALILNTVTQAIAAGRPMNEVERALELYEKLMAMKAKSEYLVAKTKFQAKCPPIPKSGMGQYGPYAPLDEIGRVTGPLLEECGLSYDWDNTYDDTFVRSECIVSHVGGHERRATFSAEIDTRAEEKGANRMQRVAIAETYAMRRSLVAVLGLTTTDIDDDGSLIPTRDNPKADSAPPQKRSGGKTGMATEKQVGLLRSRCKKMEIPEDVFLAQFNVAKWDAFPFSEVNAAIEWIKNAKVPSGG